MGKNDIKFSFLNEFKEEMNIEDFQKLENYFEEIEIENYKDLNLEELLSKFSITTEKKPMQEKGKIEQNNNTYQITLNLFYPDYVNRFTTAHEFAHYLFDKAKLTEDSLYSTYHIPGNLFDKTEARANKFAANLLLPNEVIEHEINDIDISETCIEDFINKISLKYNTSLKMAEIRIRNMGY